MSKIIGIDVSEHNGEIDWAKVKNSGVSFAIIRCGYGKKSKSTCTVDKYWSKNITGAHAAGIPIGIYFFTYAVTKADAKEEAAFVKNLIDPYKSWITLPVYYDFEYDTVSAASAKGVALGKSHFNEFTVAFCDYIKAAGYTPGVYYNLDYYNRMVDMNMVGGYAQWYAQYSSAPSSKVSGYDMWQYGSSGSVNGMTGNVDMNQADSSFLTKYAANKYERKWITNNVGTWYQHEDGTYTTNGWELIDGCWYRFDERGYLMNAKWVFENGNLYYLGADGKMATSGLIKIGADGKAVPVLTQKRYYRLGEITEKAYRPTIDKLISLGVIAGKGGEGDDLIIDLGEDAVRLLVYLDRNGTFSEVVK